MCAKQQLDPVGAPDFTLPVSIIAQIIESLKVDIVAQTLEALNINIVGQAGAIEITTPEGESLNVAITSSVALNVNITNTPVEITNPTGENLNVAVQSSIELNTNIVNMPIEITNPSGENLNVAVQSSITLNTNITNVPIEITNPEGEALDINVASSITLNTNITNVPIEITNPSGENLNVAVQSSITLNTNITNTPIEITNPVGETLDVAVQSSVALNVNITNTPVEITNPTGENLNVAVQSSTELNVNITNPTIEVTNPEGTPMEVSITTSVTLNVHIESADTFTVNIQTSTGVNIVIDKLTTEAYKEDRRTLSNNGVTASMLASNNTYRRGKMFPRGCRGFINTVEIYCDNEDDETHTLTIYFAVQPGIAPIFSVTLSIPAGGSAAWRSAAVRRFWNYDSMFIYTRGDSNAYGRIGYDTGTPSDAYASSDEVTWSPQSHRLWFKVNMTGETIGDLPVSGTINNIPIPTETSSSAVQLVHINPGETKTLITINCPGKSLWIHLKTNVSGSAWFWIEADGEKLKFYGDHILNEASMREQLITEEVSCPLMIGRHDTTNNNYTIICTLPIQWKRKLEIKVTCPSSGTANDVWANIVYLKY